MLALRDFVFHSQTFGYDGVLNSCGPWARRVPQQLSKGSCFQFTLEPAVIIVGHDTVSVLHNSHSWIVTFHLRKCRSKNRYPWFRGANMRRPHTVTVTVTVVTHVKDNNHCGLIDMSLFIACTLSYVHCESNTHDIMIVIYKVPRLVVWEAVSCPSVCPSLAWFLRSTTATANPSVCPSRAGIVPRRMKIGLCGLHFEVAQTL